MTEALIAESFGRLKKSVTDAPHQAIRPASSLIQDHPFISVAAAAGIGIAAFQVFRMMAPRKAAKGEEKRGGGGASILGQVWPMVAPYVTSMLQQQLSHALTGGQRREGAK
ncbi:MAG: hypothetical protein A4E28_02948 [Methanocella sp. PtaU1.Bin125]|nr:MAG: hypothetical protein A4E28_02948 [Methanocella sp. PtaU1.Bin125]